MWSDTAWRVVWPNPVDCAEALYIASHAFGVVGMEDEEGQSLINELIAFATQPHRIWSHRWSPETSLSGTNGRQCTEAVPDPMARNAPWRASASTQPMRTASILSGPGYLSERRFHEVRCPGMRSRLPSSSAASESGNALHASSSRAVAPIDRQSTAAVDLCSQSGTRTSGSGLTLV